MVIESTRFGILDIDDRDIIHFPQGLPGFGDEKAFAYLPYGPDSPFAFLQSVAEPGLTFLIVEPFVFFADYKFELPDDTAAAIGVSPQSPPQIFAIVTVPDKLEEMTANLLAPIAVNPVNRQAVQVVLEKTAYTTRHRLFPQGFPENKGKGAK
jgi:flagellar assembly factor FliW